MTHVCQIVINTNNEIVPGEVIENLKREGLISPKVNSISDNPDSSEHTVEVTFENKNKFYRYLITNYSDKQDLNNPVLAWNPQPLKEPTARSGNLGKLRGARIRNSRTGKRILNAERKYK